MCVGGKGDSIWRDVDGKEFGGGCFLLIIILRGAKTSARSFHDSERSGAQGLRDLVGASSVSHSTDHLGNFVKTDPALLVLLEQQLTCITPVLCAMSIEILLFYFLCTDHFVKS